MLDIGAHIVNAFHDDRQAGRIDKFACWWASHAAILAAPPPAATLSAMIERGDIFADQLQLESDDAAERFYLCALFTALMPDPDARQYLLGTDVIFDEVSTDAERVAALIELARPVA